MSDTTAAEKQYSQAELVAQLDALNTAGAKSNTPQLNGLLTPSPNQSLNDAERKLALNGIGPSLLPSGSASATGPTPTGTSTTGTLIRPSALISGNSSTGKVPTDGTSDSHDGNNAIDGTEDQVVPQTEQAALTSAHAQKTVYDGAKPVNDTAIFSQVIAPRARVRVGGPTFNGVLGFHVVNNNFLGADTFTVEIIAGLDGDRDCSWWADQIDVQIEIEVARDTSNGHAQWKSLIIGVLDEFDINWTTYSVTLHGRDMSARLIDTDIIDSFPNQKASDIAKKFAEEHGLQSDVVDSPNNAGTNYDASGKATNAMTASTFSHALNKWDFLAHHAAREGYDLWVEGTTLHYKPRTKPDKTNVWGVIFNSGINKQINNIAATRGITTLNATTLVTRRRAYLAKDIMVTVVSLNSVTGKIVRERIRGNHVKGRGPKERPAFDSNGIEIDYNTNNSLSDVEVVYDNVAPTGPGVITPDHVDNRIMRYTFNEPNLSRQQALEFATAKLHELTSHERTASFTLPGETGMHPRLIVKLIGTNSSFDQLYYISSISRTFNMSVGFTQAVEIRNSSPRDMPGTVGDEEPLVNGAETMGPDADKGPTPPTPNANTTGHSNNLDITEPRSNAAQKAARDARVNARPAGAEPVEPGSLPLSASKEQVVAAVRKQAIYEGVDPDFAERIVRKESGARLTDASGNYITGIETRYGKALGPMQMLSGTAKEMGVNAYDPASSIIGGVRYLGMQQDRFGTNQTAIAAAYNWGPGNASSWVKNGADLSVLPAETRNYVAKTAR